MADSPTITPQQAQDAATAIKGIEGVVTHPNAASISTAVTDAEPLISEVPSIIEETRHSWKTSEFWLAIGAVGTDLGIGGIETKEKAIISGLVAVYAIARGIAKNGIPHVRPWGT